MIHPVPQPSLDAEHGVTLEVSSFVEIVELL